MNEPSVDKHSDDQRDTHSPQQRNLPSTAEEPRVFSSTELLGNRREVLIRHGGEIYRLRLTRNGKLILYK